MTEAADWPRAGLLETRRLRPEPLRVEHAAEAFQVFDVPALHAWTGGAPAELTACIRPGHSASAAVARAVGLAETDELLDGEVVWRRRVPGQGTSSTQSPQTASRDVETR